MMGFVCRNAVQVGWTVRREPLKAIARERNCDCDCRFGDRDALSVHRNCDPHNLPNF